MGGTGHSERPGLDIILWLPILVINFWLSQPWAAHYLGRAGNTSQLAVLSVSGLYESELSIFTRTTIGPAKIGFTHSLNDIPVLCYPRHLALTQNVQRLLTVPLSINTLMNSKSLVNHMIFPSRTLWTRRDARGVVGRKLAKENTYILGDSVQSTSVTNFYFYSSPTELLLYACHVPRYFHTCSTASIFTCSRILPYAQGYTALLLSI
jgi:hypothetical protein